MASRTISGPCCIFSVGALFLTCCSGSAFAQGADNCGQAPTLPFSPWNTASVPFDTTTATNDTILSCAQEAIIPQSSPDVWYRFDANTAGDLRFFSYGNCDIAVYNACGGTELACGTAMFSSFTITAPVIAGATYYIALQANDPDCTGCPGSGTVYASFSSSNTPSNDSCQSASVALMGSNPFDNGAATTDTSVACDAGSANDVWFSFVAPATGPYRFRIDSNQSAVSGGVLTLFASCGGSELACSSPQGDSGARIDYGLSAGQSVRVRVASSSISWRQPDNGAGALVIEPTPTPPNDTCSGALAITTGTTLVDLTNTFYNDHASASCLPMSAGEDTADVWYVYTAQSTGAISMTLLNPPTQLRPWLPNATVAVYSACTGAELACRYASLGALNHPWICNLPVQQGQTFLIRVASYGPNANFGGLANLVLSAPVTTVPSNDSCTNPLQVGTGNTSFDNSASCGTDMGYRTLWFRYTNAASGLRNVRIRTCGSSFPNYLAAFASCESNGFFNANSGGGCNGNELGGTIRVCLGAGESVLIGVGSIDQGQYGPGMLNISSNVPASNDTCDAAATLNEGSNTVNTTLGCGVADLPCRDYNTEGYTFARDVWYRFVAPYEGKAYLQLNTPQARSQAAMTVQQDCSGPILLCANGDQRADICMPMQAGAQYLVAISEIVNDSAAEALDFGTSTLHLSFINDSFSPPADAIPEPEACDFILHNGECEGIAIAEIAPGVAFVGTNAVFDPVVVYNDVFDGYYFDLAEPGSVRFIGQTEFRGWIDIIDNGSFDECLGNSVYSSRLGNGCLNNFDTGDVLIQNAGRHEVRIQADDTPDNWRTCNNIDIRYWVQQVCTDCGPICNDIDFNNDGSLFDPQDIDAFLSVYSEGDCVPSSATCDDIDFNNDGSLFDPCDIDSFLIVFSEGPCTSCGV